jgi:ribosome maturation factor RimP
MDFSILVGRRVSVLITGKGEKKETYNGTVESVEDNFIVMKSLPSVTFEIEKFLIRTDIIESVWVFKET